MTDELARRTARLSDHALENRMLSILARQLAEQPGEVLQTLTDLLVANGLAQSAGIGIVMMQQGDDLFRWDALSGGIARLKGVTTPVDKGPCGDVVRQNQLLLLRRADGSAQDGAKGEMMLVPLQIDGVPVGMLWMAHDRAFDQEDARLLTSLSVFASAALRWRPHARDNSVAIDALVARDLQERQRLLLAELQNRVRNILTVVRSVFSRTVEHGGTLEEVGSHFRGRLDALARTQLGMTHSLAGNIDLENLIRDELVSVGIGDGPLVGIEGPDVALDPNQAELLGLAFHELTTNALKYGALRVPGASLKISWAVNMEQGGGRRLDLIWQEQGVPAVSVQPHHEGFGRELIEDALPYQLGATTRLDIGSGGIRCSISVPLRSGAAGDKE